MRDRKLIKLAWPNVLAENTRRYYTEEAAVAAQGALATRVRFHREREPRTVGRLYTGILRGLARIYLAGTRPSCDDSRESRATIPVGTHGALGAYPKHIIINSPCRGAPPTAVRILLCSALLAGRCAGETPAKHARANVGSETTLSTPRKRKSPARARRRALGSDRYRQRVRIARYVALRCVALRRAALCCAASRASAYLRLRYDVNQRAHGRGLAGLARTRIMQSQVATTAKSAKYVKQVLH